MKKKNKQNADIQLSTRMFMIYLAMDTLMCHKLKIDKTVLFHHYMLFIMHACMFIPHKDKNILREYAPKLLLLESMALITFIQRSGSRKLVTFWNNIQIINTLFFRIPYWYHMGFNCIIPKLESNPIKKICTGLTLTMITLDFVWLRQMLS
jgi:hypothetical protein